MIGNCNGNKTRNYDQFGNRSKCFMVIYVFNLSVAFSNKLCLILFNFAIKLILDVMYELVFDFMYPFSSNGMFA